jgi:hypothetical protein
MTIKYFTNRLFNSPPLEGAGGGQFLEMGGHIIKNQ